MRWKEKWKVMHEDNWPISPFHRMGLWGRIWSWGWYFSIPLLLFLSINSLVFPLCHISRLLVTKWMETREAKKRKGMVTRTWSRDKVERKGFHTHYLSFYLSSQSFPLSFPISVSQHRIGNVIKAQKERKIAWGPAFVLARYLTVSFLATAFTVNPTAVKARKMNEKWVPTQPPDGF